MTDTEDTVEVEVSTLAASTPLVLQEYTCVRCGFHYKKAQDYEPLLCYRCLRFLGKKVWQIVQQITPPVSRPVVSEI